MLLLGVAVLFLILSPKEPKYQGRTLSQWLVSYDPAATPEARREPEEAILHIGTNGLPLLLQWIRSQDPDRLSQIRRAARFRRVVNSMPIPATLRKRLLEDQRWLRFKRATDALAALGPVAAPAIPELTHLLNSTNDDFVNKAAFVLPHLGPDALPPLMAVLTNIPVPTRSIIAARYMHYLGTNAAPAVPVLVKCIDDPDFGLRQFALYSLGELRLNPDLVVPALDLRIFTMQQKAIDEDAEVFIWIASSALAKFGPQAASAVPTLLTCLTNHSAHVRKAATNALLKIAPEVLTNAPAQ